MSGYGKTPHQQDYNNPRVPSAASHFSTPHQSAYHYPQTQPHFPVSQGPPSSQAPHRAIIQEPVQPPTSTEPSYARSFEAEPIITRFSPQSGQEGTTFIIYLESGTDLTTDSRSFKFIFGSRRCQATLTKSQERADEFEVRGQVPQFSLTGWSEPAVKVYLVIEDSQAQEELGTLEIGTFTYTDTFAQSYNSSPQRSLAKRKRNDEHDETRSPAKRPTSQPIRPKSADYGAYGYGAQHGGGHYSQQSAGTSNERNYAMYPSNYSHSEASGSAYQPQHASPRHFPYPSYSEHSQQPHTPSAASWASNQSVAPSTGAHIATGSIVGPGSSPPEQSPVALRLPSDGANPPLIRTTTLQQQAQSSIPGSTPTSAGFNPYSIYQQHKAILEINGQLSDMAERWSTEEWENRRRLVQFWRQQKGNTIHTTFQPVTPSDRQPNSICISCIWWAEKQECYVTSVDCIFLLESLIAVRFTVEEKNRIRRNLEGFRPLTVSKAKQDSENFFKLIMAFPNPKPRNIEKDVKVFPWSVLPHALKKIIGKYSASYSSTASVITDTPGSSAYPGQPGDAPQLLSSEGTVRGTSSPSTTDSTTSTAPTAVANTASLSTVNLLPPKQSSATSSPIGRVSGSTGLSAPSSSLTPTGAPHAVWPQQLPSAHQSIPPTGARSNAWGEMAYIEGNPVAAAPSTAYYQQPSMTTDERETVPGSSQNNHMPGNVNVP